MAASAKPAPQKPGSFAVKSYQQGVQRLVAACDEELLGSSYREGKFRLDVPAAFYDGLRVDETNLSAYLRSATIANLVGARTVDLARRLGMIQAGHVLTVQGIPHAQFLVMETP